VAEETAARWPLAVSSFTQVLEIVDGTRWVGAPAAGRPRKRQRR
jgi:phosphoglycolate phosphatase